jgi:hypothetical protein
VGKALLTVLTHMKNDCKGVIDLRLVEILTFLVSRADSDLGVVVVFRFLALELGVELRLRRLS